MPSRKAPANSLASASCFADNRPRKNIGKEEP